MQMTVMQFNGFIDGTFSVFEQQFFFIQDLRGGATTHGPTDPPRPGAASFVNLDNSARMGVLISLKREHRPYSRFMAQTAASLSDTTSAALPQGDFEFLLQVARPGLWTTTAMFYLMPLGHSIAFRSAKFWAGLAYVLIPLGLLLYGVNDIVDVEADRVNPRKGTFLFGSLGRTEQLAALRWQIVAVQIPFVAAFLVWIGLRVLLWFGALVLAVVLYNARRIGFKRRPPFDVLIQSSYLLVFVLSAWVNGAPQPPWQTFLFGALFAMHSHLFGEVMDISPDRESGRTTTAVRIGAVRTKLLIAAFLSVEAALVARYFLDPLVAGFLVAGVLCFVVDACWFSRNSLYSPKMMKLFMWIWNAAAVLLILWDYSYGTFTLASL
jgi:4-hydroxybenzoate polyprenyltransferase